MRIPAIFLTFITMTSMVLHAQPDDVVPIDEPLSVVQVNVTSQAYNFFRPWSKKSPGSKSAIGTVLEGNLVLVSAELVANHTYLELEMPGSGQKVPASIKAVDYSANLALLTADDPTFLDQFEPLPLAEGTNLGDIVEIWQVENTGALLRTDALITSVRVAPYPMRDAALLVYEMTATLQSRDGSFIVPLVADGKLVGVVTRYDSGSQNAQAVPVEVIRHFLQDATEGTYQGFPRAGLAFSATRDPQFRKFIGLPPDNGGVYITEVVAGEPGDTAGLKVGDVVLEINGHHIDQDGNYLDPRYGKLSLGNLIGLHSYSGDIVKLSIFRDGEKMNVDLKPLHRSPEDYVSAPYMIDRGPRFVILGGLMFQELSRQYLMEWGSKWRDRANSKLVYYDANQQTLFAGEDRKIVFLSQVLPTPATLGYHRLSHLVVTRVNGVEILSLADLQHALTTPLLGFHKIEFEDDPKVIYLSPEDATKTNQALQSIYGISELQRMN